VQSRTEINLQVGQGVAVREFALKSGHGYADYLLYVDGQAVGVIEAKKAGSTLTGVEVQAEKYAAGMPANASWLRDRRTVAIGLKPPRCG